MYSYFKRDNSCYFSVICVRTVYDSDFASSNMYSFYFIAYCNLPISSLNLFASPNDPSFCLFKLSNSSWIFALRPSSFRNFSSISFMSFYKLRNVLWIVNF